jgi:hypothetical protein
MNPYLAALQDFLTVVFADLERFVRSRGINVLVQTGFSENDAFALRAYISLALQPGEELVVVSVDCKICERYLAIESDSALTGGEIISEGPTAQLGALDSAEFPSLCSRWGDDFKGFIIV